MLPDEEELEKNEQESEKVLSPKVKFSLPIAGAPSCSYSIFHIVSVQGFFFLIDKWFVLSGGCRQWTKVDVETAEEDKPTFGKVETDEDQVWLTEIASMFTIIYW